MTITYVLLAASIFLDATTIVMLLFSDWMMLSLLNVKKLGYWTELLAMHIVKIKSRWLKRRSWSREMPQLNIISNCLKNSAPKEAPWQRMMNWIKEKLSLVQETKLFPGSLGDNKAYTLRALQRIKATQELQEKIVEYAQRCLNESWVKPALYLALNQTRTPHGTDVSKWIESTERFVEYIERFPLDLKVLLWHIATELCFHQKSEYLHSRHLPQIEIETKDSKSRGVERRISKKDACKYISNYMMHMVVMRPEMMSNMGETSKVFFWNAYDSMFRFIQERGIDVPFLIPNAKVEDLCREMMTTESGIIKYNDILNTAQVLASKMLLIKEEQRWQTMTTAWVELLIKMGKVSRGNMRSS